MNPSALSLSDVSIILCTRERPDMLRGALAAIAAGTDPAVEVIVVDSASTDSRTREVAEAAGVRYVRTDTKGLSIARNLGLDSSTRPVVVYTDDDCSPTPGWIEALLDAFADERVAVATGRMLDHTLVDTDVPPTDRITYRSTVQGLDAGHGAVMAFRRSTVQTLGGFDDTLGAGRYLAGAEDLDIFCRALAAGGTAVFVPDSVVLHVNTRNPTAYRRLMRGYGLGLGALVGKWWRMSPLVGGRMTATLAVRSGRRLVRSAKKRGRGARDELAMVEGILRGYLRSRHLRLSGSTFVDEYPPTPIRLSPAPVAE
ncbi:glycosyltransferase [Rathayibacter sp. VKM Ac-2803]|uniref:glycosyltransferase family 2 protein n=1 Tax=Rathayibacter sp. VKM Ac-2803 TaxID=2609256 RepID=UPI00135937BC|nr:glycosyltransferase family A protein [Rathayibacter sp. VKM Ac-2803]MWV47736.1 glycosyltransferase [Rathayibacter sp. VKM Ac-2803]